MEEKGTKRREWVKNAAIIFLTILLILTFFSRTIQNYSLPEVAAQYVQSGTITAKIRGTGVVESGDPYNVTVEQTRKVASVAVRVGDEVQQGDPLVYLEDEESEELKAAEKALEAAQLAYDEAFLSAEVTASSVQNSHSNIPTTTYRQQINNAQKAVDDAQAEVDRIQKDLDDITAQLAGTPENDADISEETKAYNEAKAAYDQAKADFDFASSRLETLEGYQEYVSDGDSGEDLMKVEQQVKAAKLERIQAKNVLDQAQRTLDQAQAALDSKKAEGDTTGTISSLTQQQNAISADLKVAQSNLEKKTKDLTELTTNINQTLHLESYYDAVIDAQETYQEELEKSIGAVITAPISGTVTTINAVSGKEVSAQDPVAILQPEGEGYTLSFSVTNDQAKRLSVGDVAELVNAWRYDDVEVVLSSIRPDPAKPGENRMLTFKVTGEVTAGQSLNVSVGEKSATYDAIVPNSAIREDNNGKFVLVVESRPSPLGNRYVATRMNVEVLASDDTQSAVSGLYGYEFVITTSTAPVEAGQLVRLPENN